ncbi:MAG TPA: nucleotidyltransferase family protein [Gemmatimonadaceae bacterium]|nr:nucleotidyltransferase family protein [Gemmatimonadaceae bacterium]
MTPSAPTSPKYAEPPDDVLDAGRRLAAFGRTQDPAHLWPRLTEAARVSAAHELARVTSEVLAGSRAVALDPAQAHDPYALTIAGHTTGMGPIIGRWAEDGLITGAAPALDFFALHLRHARRRFERMERELLPVLDALIGAGISPIVLKGFHTAHVYFEEPGMRRMSDVDLMVAPSEVAEAERALSAAGFVPETEALRPYKRDWIGPCVDPRLFSVELFDERSKWILELHASLDRIYHPGAIARLDSELEFRSLESFDLAGRQVRVLSPELLVVTLACHCSQELDGTRLARLLELVRVIRGTGSGRPPIKWNDVLEILQRTGAARFTFPALALVDDLAPGTVDARVLEVGRRASTWAALHTVARLAPAGGSLDDRGVLRQLMWTRGPVAILQRLLRNIWPAAFTRPGDVIPGWRVRLRRLRRGVMSFNAPNERDAAAVAKRSADWKS